MLTLLTYWNISGAKIEAIITYNAPKTCNDLFAIEELKKNFQDDTETGQLIADALNESMNQALALEGNVEVEDNNFSYNLTLNKLETTDDGTLVTRWESSFKNQSGSDSCAKDLDYLPSYGEINEYPKKGMMDVFIPTWIWILISEKFWKRG